MDYDPTHSDSSPHDDWLDDAIHGVESSLHGAVDAVDNFISPHMDISPALSPDALHTTIVFDPATLPGLTPLPGIAPFHIPMPDVIGDPVDDASCWHLQEGDHTCAIAAQQFVIEQVLHHPVTEAELTQLSQQNGWFDDAAGGTPVADIGNLLQAFGLHVDHTSGQTFDELVDQVNAGHHPIVGLCAEVLWHQDPATPLSDASVHPGLTGDHAVEVIGIDRSDPNNPQVILNDSGSLDGRAERVDLTTFEAAWAYTNNAAVYSW